jgi:hypothetical protein
MLNAIISPLAALRHEEHHPAGHQVWKLATFTRFPGGCEVHINENKDSWSDPADFAENIRGERGEGDHDKSRRVSARRAKTAVRHRCKMIAADQLLTLTYRENMTDFDRLKKDFKEFVRRLRLYGEFEYIAGIEKQKRGALHLHLAINALPFWMKNAQGVKVKSANLVRSVWRGVVGLDNGNIDLTKPRRNAAHRVASYISKYISKALEDAVFNAKSYWSSRGIPKPKKDKLWFRSDMSTSEIVAKIAADEFNKGHTEISQYSDPGLGFCWFSFSK